VAPANASLKAEVIYDAGLATPKDDIMARPPNILLITSDQQRGDCFGFEGCPVKTPHLDRMARAGTRFSTCITPSVFCQPARASMLTGLLPYTHGVADNGINLDPALGEAGFGGALTRAGYETGFIGKAHFSTKTTYQPTDTPECNYGSQTYPDDWNGPYMGFGHVELVVHGHLNKARENPRPPVGQHYERFFHSRGEEGEAARLWATELPPSTGAAQTWHSALPVQWHNSTWIGDRTIEWLRRRDRTKPFCMWASFPDPHHAFDCPEPWSRLHHPESVDLPDHRTLDLDRRPWWHEASLTGDPIVDDPEIMRYRKKGQRVPPQSDAQLRDMIANYYGMIALVDHNVGRIRDALAASGDDGDTIVIFTTDHGDMLGDHGLYLKGPTLYEGVLRVGMIVQGPDIPAGAVVDDPVSTLDLTPTFCDLAGIAKPSGLQGQSLVPLIAGDPAAARAVAYSEWFVHKSRYGVDLDLRTVRTRTHKCTFEMLTGAGELYDLVNDPNEMDNLFDDPGRAAVRREMEEILQARPGSRLDSFPPQIGMA
jgi:arylsulfatase A-like enzyme